jgi:hypothetical protein
MGIVSGAGVDSVTIGVALVVIDVLEMVVGGVALVVTAAFVGHYNFVHKMKMHVRYGAATIANALRK